MRVPAYLVGVGPLQPCKLPLPVPRRRPRNADLGRLCRWVGRALPVSWCRVRNGAPRAVCRAAGALHESQVRVDPDGRRIVVPHLQPDLPRALLPGAQHGALGQRPTDAVAPVTGVGRHVGDQGQFAPLVHLEDQAHVADDLAALFPDVARQRHGCALHHPPGPAQEILVLAGLAHLLHVRLAVVVHGGFEAQLDQVRHLGQVVQDVQRPQRNVGFGMHRDRDGGHSGIIARSRGPAFQGTH